MSVGNDAPKPPEWTAPDDRAATGRDIRKLVPRSTLGEWAPAADRVDPVQQLAAQEATRVADLVPIRHERMAASPFAFFRGAANVMAADLAPLARTGLTVQLCGDAHLANFGGFGTPERSLVFDLNDFDETLPGPFEWDLARLSASFEVAARSNAFDEAARHRVQRLLVRSYASALAEFAAMGHLQLWYVRLTAEDILQRWGSELSPEVVDRFQRNVLKAQRKDQLKALKKLTTVDGGEPRFLSDPPVLQPISEVLPDESSDQLMDLIDHALRVYRRTLQPDRRLLLERYRFVDLARKVVGVGSVGTRCWVALLMGRDGQDPLFLQVKEAEASVLEPYLGASRYSEHGERVVNGQRLIQAAGDIFLGWDRLDGVDGRTHDYYFRQLWDWKTSAVVEEMSPEVLAVYGQICGSTLARAHARTGDAVALTSYVGSGKTLARSLEQFASSYADQNELDHRAFRAAVAPLAVVS